MLEKIKMFLYRLFGIIWVTLMCSFMAAPHDIGGTEFNGILSFLFWILLFYIIIKKRVLIAGILSTVVMAGISISKFGWGKLPYVAEELGSALVMLFIGYMLYKLVFGERLDKMGEDEKRHRKDTSTIRKNHQRNFSYDPKYDYTTASEPGLRNGSDEYWAYRDSAEQIYRAFCDARTVDQRRYYKERGEELKTRLFIEYGYNDESVKSICERFLDLRV